ncbi:hypothetical protein CRM22_007440 [Opisthorchis felineus]|uniref:Cation-transporting ATPase n=1 Tax=Opisthorchis felineus TaxID=147828 RepID=A0A4S2LP76_OPIFE|nr:hypothetical protein CRM22_007440 [Opisthorchis felineus]
MRKSDLNGGLQAHLTQQDEFIFEPDGASCPINGYKFSCTKTTLVYLACILTCGILWLILHWFPRLMLQWSHRPCSLMEADKVLIKDPAGVYYVLKVKKSVIDGASGVTFGPVSVRKSSQFFKDVEQQFTEDETMVTFFIYKQLKYTWNQATTQFLLLSECNEHSYSKLFPAKPLQERIVLARRALYEPNEIVIRLTPIIKMLLTKCLNPFYCFQAFSCALWFAQDYWIYALCIVVLSIVSLCLQIYEMRRNELALKRTVCGSAPVSVYREVNGFPTFQQVNSTELVPGDIIEIPRKGCTMHCDAFVLNGNCIVNESTLTGESVPVTKTPLPERQRKNESFNLPSLSRHVLFGGTCVIQTRNFNNEAVLAIVVRTGFRTAKGELVRSILYPKPMKFKFTEDAIKFVLAMGVLALIGMPISIYFMYRAQVETSSLVMRTLDLITIVVSPALPMAMTVGIVFAQRRLRAIDIFCINPSAITVCGVINIACFDKTGTLTEDGMDLWGVLPNIQGVFGEPIFKPSELENGPLLEAMATCHSLTLIDGVLSGDPLDLKMFQSTKWEFLEEFPEGQCKFDMAIPAVVRPVRENLLEEDQLVGAYEVGILRQFPFTSSLQRMSVITRSLYGSEFCVYAKGAPEMIETLCRRDTVPSDFQSVLLKYARDGYRVLALAWRPLKVSCVRALRIERERAEQNLLFLGYLIMENRLKKESNSVIQTLKDANIRPVMVTGDNMLTAISVARDCEFIDEWDRIIIVSAKPPPHAATSNSAEVDSPAHPYAPQVNAHLGTELDDVQPLVEFHYAEDLHKPVTEVTATHVLNSVLHTQRTRQSRQTVPQTSVKKTRFFDRWWPLGTKRRCSVTQPEFDSQACAPVRSVHFVTDTPVSGDQHRKSKVGFRKGPNLLVPPVPRVNIRMIDRPDFHLAISGKTWSTIKEHYPWLIPKLVVKGTVFARFSPDQKTQLIETLQSVGYFVAMCGDGANDCGALKTAHAGVSLSEAEASVASPFTSKQQNITCVPALIREGRCALVTNFGIFKFMSGYSLVQFFMTIILYVVGCKVTNGQFLYMDLFLITPLGITFAYTKAYPHLSVDPPSIHLLSTVPLTSLGLQLVTNFTLQILAFVWVRQQPWYFPLFEVDSSFEARNYENTAVFTVVLYQFIILAVVFSQGAPYRRSILSNYFFVLNLLACIAGTLYLTSYPHDDILKLLETIRIPSIRFVILLHGIVLANFLICYLLEMVVDGVSFRRHMLHIRRALFPRFVQIKDYERIREEIDRLAGSWPPIIRSASVQALPSELFNEDVPIGLDDRSCKRAASVLSSESEDEELVLPTQIDSPTKVALVPPDSSIEQCGDVRFQVGDVEAGILGESSHLIRSRHPSGCSVKIPRYYSLEDVRFYFSGIQAAGDTSAGDSESQDVFISPKPQGEEDAPEQQYMGGNTERRRHSHSCTQKPT